MLRVGGGKEEIGHIKGSLGHDGWYLTQIHIFHSDGRGMVEGERLGERDSGVCVGGWFARARRGWMGGARVNGQG